MPEVHATDGEGWFSDSDIGAAASLAAEAEQLALPPSPVLNVREVARWMRVNPATVYRLANAGKMPYFKAGRDFRFRRDEIDAWSKTFGREHPVASKATRPRRKRSKTPSYMKVPIVPAVEGDF